MAGNEISARRRLSEKAVKNHVSRIFLHPTVRLALAAREPIARVYGELLGLGEPFGTALGSGMTVGKPVGAGNAVGTPLGTGRGVAACCTPPIPALRDTSDPMAVAVPAASSAPRATTARCSCLIVLRVPPYAKDKTRSLDQPILRAQARLTAIAVWLLSLRSQVTNIWSLPRMRFLGTDEKSVAAKKPGPPGRASDSSSESAIECIDRAVVARRRRIRM